MSNNNQRILIALCILFAVVIIGLVFYSSRNVTENFEENKKNTEKPVEETSKKQLKLSKKEEEIYNDLLSNKLTDVNIDSLINSGILTENMIERFLSKIQKKDSFVVEPQPLVENSNIPIDRRSVEGFTGFTSLTPMYATASISDTPTTNRIYSQYY